MLHLGEFLLFIFFFGFSGSPVGAIVGGSVGGVIVVFTAVAAAGGGVIVYRYRKKSLIMCINSYIHIQQM